MSGHPRIKHCGITSVEDAHLAAEAGAWALGMVFYPPSPRACSFEDALEIGAALRRTCELAGVFVNAPMDRIEEYARVIPLSLIQLHGDEGPSFCKEVARRTGAKVIKATRVGTSADMQAARAFHTDFHLLDANVPGSYGGTGKLVDWKLVVDHPIPAPLILSGGLTPENVAEGIEIVRPVAVDVASGTEKEPGVKDPEKLQAFFNAVKGTAEVAA